MTDQEFKQKLIEKLQSGKYELVSIPSHKDNNERTLLELCIEVDRSITSNNMYFNMIRPLYFMDIPFSICALLIRDFEE